MHISDEIVQDADLILTMEKSHTDYIKSHWPFFDSVYELKCFGRNENNQTGVCEIMDPIGMEYEAYINIYNELHEEIIRIAPRVFSLAQKKMGTDSDRGSTT